jgi:two-component system sensor histidine kinase YesM
MKVKLLDRRLFCFAGAFGVLFIFVFGIAVLESLHTRWLALLLVLGLAAMGLAAAAYFFWWNVYQKTTRQLGAMASSRSLDEIQFPAWYYNKQCYLLSERLRTHLKVSSSFELSKRQAQYQALQNQINPHFLYNTLESIRSEALISGLDSVAKMCEALAAFFRYTISNQENLVTMDEEMQNIKTYFYIQQYRFGKRLSLKMEYEERDIDSLLKCKIPKLTLQPIVENAIIHGIEQKLGDGTVTVRLTLTERCLLIKISDDGVGMSPDMLRQINRRLAGEMPARSEKGGIAIANVNTRIKLLFGDAYGITLYSTSGIGTDVEITLPRAA